ncbi:MAG TPA: DEAD/DEAH box helicase [Opitutaceae bacterium]
MIRLHLPPNLAAAAPRDAIGLKVELDLSVPPPAALLPALALLQRFGAKPAPVLFLQLSRAQLRELVTALRGQSVFYRVEAPEKPLLWVGPILRGVSEHLGPAPTEAPAPRPAAAPRSSPPAAVRPRPAPVAITPLTVDGSEHFLALTLPSRESALYSAALDLVKTHGFALEPSNRKWWLRDRHKVLNFLAAHRATLEDEFHAEFTANFEKNTARLHQAEVSVEASPVDDGFAVTVGLRAGKADGTALAAAVAANRGYVEDRGEVYLIDPTQLARLTAAQRALAGEPGAAASGRRTHRIPTARLTEVQDVLAELAPHFQPPETWRSRGEALRNISTLPPAPIPAALDALLRPYQRLGVAWLWHLHRNGLGGVLADEMGLGKTLQALAVLAALPSAKHTPAAVSLVVCPASLVENWRREAARFAPSLRVFAHHGASRIETEESFRAYDLVITSYATLARDQELFSVIDFACIVADEAQHIKNRKSQNAQALRTLHAHGRFVLTGTPLENSLDDLRSLFEFLMPGLVTRLPSGLKSDEREWYDERLRAQAAPYLLRRTKQAVAKELPPKIEQIIWCEPTSAQAALYKRQQENAERALLDLAADGANEGALRFATLTQLLRLRQICCDPRLVDPGANAADSTKLEAFREILDEALDEGHRLLVFSQFTSQLALIREELKERGLDSCYLDGSMTPKARQAEVDRFQASDAVPVFLLSLKAGGAGLNLTGADTVVHLDPWWNPAAEAQATDRAHRIGQTRTVTSYKLICSGTVEEKVLALQDSKRALLAGVLEASDAASAKLSLGDLRDLLHV